jgi:RNA polymerase sigma factor (sigma-70 family)
VDEVEDNPQLAALMAQMAWLRRLARALLKGADGADDLVHDTWMTAAGRAPADPGSLRPWLGRVALNLVRGRSRARSRRIAREQASGEFSDPVRTPEELVRAIELQRLVADEVLRLAEPYRSTILLHYVEELSSAEIARRLGVPEGTVRRRLKVALDELRGRLGAADAKSTRGLAVVLAPLASPAEPRAASAGAGAGAGAGAVTTLLGVVAMKKLIAAFVVVVLVVLLAGGAVWWRRSGQEPPPSRDGAAAGPARGPGRGATSGPERDGARVPPWFAARGAPQRAIAGRVTFEGKPVAGATVVLHDMLAKAGARAALERRTGPDGRFDLGPQLPAAYEVVASAAGRTAAIARVELADPTLKPPAHELELRLGGCAASVAGTVFDAAGGTLAHARVRRDGLVGVDADGTGAYELCLPRGGSAVTFSADGYGAVVLDIDAHGAVRQDVVLVPEAVIAGRVVEADGEHPVAGILVGIHPKEWGRDHAAPAYALSDANGQFRIAGLLPGRYRVSGIGDGAVTGAVEAVAAVGSGNPEVTLTVTLVAWVRGRVVSAGAPVAGASLVASLGSPPRRSEVAISQADGSFVMARVPLGDVSFTAAPYRVVSPSRLKIESAGVRDGIVIEVERLATIRGRVTRSGVPAAGASVCCVPTAAGTNRTVSDAEGTYELVGVQPGTHRINAVNEELGAMMDSVPVTIAAGEERVVDLEMDLAATISGVVVDQHDRPVKGVFVKWTNEQTGDLGRAITDARGRYRCGAMTGGARYRAAVFATSSHAPYPTADGSAYPSVELPDGKAIVDGVRIAIEVRALAIAGRVIDAAGEPVADAAVKAMAVPAGQPPVFNSWMKLPLAVTDRDGAFEIAGLPPGSYAVWARSPDGGEGIAAGLAAGDGAATIRIERPGAIEGKLVDFPSAPAVFATMLGTGAINVEASSVTQSAFRIGGLRPGRYVVSAQTRQEGEAQLVEVKSGVTSSLVLAARGRGTIEGTVLDFRTRAPIAGAACHAFASAGGVHGVTSWESRTAPRSDAQGRVLLDPAPAGPVTVSCVMPATRRSAPSAELVLAPGGRAAVQLWSAELLADYPSTIGIGFDWRVAPPRIAEVRAGGPAARAGLLVGDLVLAVGGASMAGLNGEGVRHIIDGRAAGAEVDITVARGSQRKTFTVAAEPGNF